MRESLAVAALVLFGGCHSLDPNASLGSVANPVRAHTFLGEFEYFSRLRCPDGTKPHVQQLLRRPRGLNGYRVRCIYLNAESKVYFDSFHPQYAEIESVPGFYLAGTPDRHRLFWLDQ